jgi:hypothetical protein
MDLQNLNTLKQMALTVEDIEEPWKYFFDEFGAQQEFHQHGQAADPEFLQTVVEGIGEQLFKQPVMIMQFHLSEIPEYNFFHGVCALEGRVMSVMYFKDADTGLFSLMMGGVGSQVLFGRFTLLGNEETRAKLFTGPVSRQTH